MYSKESMGNKLVFQFLKIRMF